MPADQITYPQQGDLSNLAGWLAAELGSARFHLYDHFRIPLPTDVVADYHESSFVGYAPLGPVGFTAPYINGGGKAETDTPALTWTFTGGAGTAVVYGIFVTDASGLKLLAVAPFQSPVTLNPGANSMTRTLQVTAVSEI